VTLPVVWIPDANEDLREARAWYDNIRPELGERFALAVETTVEAIAEHPLQFPVAGGPRRRYPESISERHEIGACVQKMKEEALCGE
jgi:plasmid stabilization system protein ParE